MKDSSLYYAIARGDGPLSWCGGRPAFGVVGLIPRDRGVMPSPWWIADALTGEPMRVAPSDRLCSNPHAEIVRRRAGLLSGITCVAGR